MKIRDVPWYATLLAATLSLSVVAPRHAAAQDEEMMMEAPAPKQVSRASIKRLFEIIRSEMTVREVQKAASKNYQLEPARIHALARNARVKGLMPRISASFSNVLGNRFTNTKDGLFPILPSPAENPNPNFFKERMAESSDQLTWSVSASWDLDRLIFAAEALDAKSLTSMEENLIREVTTLFFSRRRVLASLILSPPDDDEEFFYELMRLDELTATLDAFTGGRFSTKAWNWEKDLLGGQ
jgi:hypothetical protein